MDTPEQSEVQPKEKAVPQSQPGNSSIAEPVPVVKEIHHHHYERRGLSLSRLLGGALLILIGLAYLANSLGWTDIHVDIWRLWPVLIILLGLSILSRRGWVSWVVSGIVTLIILGAVAWAVFGSGQLNNRAVEQRPVEITQAEGATSVGLGIETGAGTLQVQAGSDQVATGVFETNYAELTTSSQLSEGRQEVAVKVDGSWRGWGNHRNDLDLQLNPDLDYALSIDSGAMDMNLDLRQLRIGELTIDTGASSLDLELSDVVDSEVFIKAGASSVDIRLPRTVGAKLTLETGLSSQDLDDFIKQSDDTYVSTNYETAEKKIDFTLELGVSDLDVSWR